MKDLRTHLYEDLGMGTTLGFTMDDELAADYIYAFEKDDWNVNGIELKDIDLWWSLGTDYINYVLQQSRFTGCLGETTDELEVYRMKDFDTIFLQACEVVSNGEGGKNRIDDDWGHFVLCYKGHEPFSLTDLNDTDWKEYDYAINPRAKWRNVINKTGLEWIIWNDDDSVWIRNRSSYASLIKYTGWSIWKNGKCEAGKLVYEKK